MNHAQNSVAVRSGDLFVRESMRPQILDLYRQWLILNKPLYTKYFNIVAMLFMAVLIPFDFILFQEPLVFVRFRVISILIFAFSLLLLDGRSAKTVPDGRDRFDLVLLVPAVLFNGLYAYFLYITKGSPYTVVLIANYMVIFLSTFFCHRFWREQYSLNISAIHGILLVAALRPEIMKDCLLLVIFHVCSLVAAFFFRREFVGSLHERFDHLSCLVPKKIARYIVISHGKLSLEQLLEAKERFTVCLCSDWRNYQKLAQTHESDYICRLFERFYDIVFEELESVAPEGNYYANWTADELFVIFYSESDDKEATKIEALTFAHILATKVSTRVRQEFDIDLAYDIGLASGFGMLGLQGPSRLKKTTLTGESAGTAKRLETEGKHIRNQSPSDNLFPIVLMDEELWRTADRKQLFEELPFKKISAQTKNIERGIFYKWQYCETESDLFHHELELALMDSEVKRVRDSERFLA